MTEVRLRARTVSEIVDAAFALYRRDGGQYILIMAVCSVPRLIAQLIWQRPPSDFIGHPEVVVYSLLIALVSAFTFTVGDAAIMKFGSEVYLGQPADTALTVRAVIPKVLLILFAGFLKGMLYFVGLLCLLVGALYVAARFFALTQTIVLEDAGLDGAFTRSSELSDGRKRHILNTLLLVYIIYWLLSIGVLALGGIVRNPVVTIAIGTVFTIVAYPIIALTGMLLYYDCRIRNEGYDIEHMAAAMDAPPAPAVA